MAGETFSRVGSTVEKRWSLRRALTAALAVSVAYYLGARLGLLLRLPEATPSVLWPPNALLTSALLVIPPRWWIVCLVAAFPAHLTLHWATDWSLPLVVLLYLTNCSEALIAASGMRWLSDAPTRFDSLWRVLVFLLAAVFIAPFVSSFLDAGVVTTFEVEPYWQVWRTRFFANMLTELTVVPAAVTLATQSRAWLRRVTPGRMIEATALMTGLLGVWVTVFAWPAASRSLIPGAVRAPLAFLVPFIMWAAVRFGPPGASVALLTATVLTITAAAHGLSPFQNLTPGETLIGLQVLLIVVAAPSLVLAAAIEERRTASRALAERLEFEELLSQLSQAFVHLPSDQMRQAFEVWLRRVGEHLRVECLMLFRCTESARDASMMASWTGESRLSVSGIAVRADFPWTRAQVLGNREVVFSTLHDLPLDAEPDRASLLRLGAWSGLALPLAVGGPVVGCLACLRMRVGSAWSPDLVGRLRFVAEVFGNAMARQESEDALRASETLKSAILESLTSGVAVLDRQGHIIAVNERWMRLGSESSLNCTCEPAGGDLLAACRRFADADVRSRTALDGITAVLSGSAPHFTLQHASSGEDGPRYWVLAVRPLNRPAGGAVVTHAEITERKRAELEADALRSELAHIARVATMGELTSSLAHELNQPLSAIVFNAQAASRFLSHARPPLDEVRDSLADIVGDGLRAGSVIKRTRDMLRKVGPLPTRLDLNVLVHDVIDLVANEALIRNVSVDLALPPRPTFVNGDRMQLQQVVLNLLMNALEAMSDAADSRRQIRVQAGCLDSRVVEVSVRDNGPGVPSEASQIFDAFYTTKPSGMGMGLSIARSIVEAHGGSIQASNSADGGAVVVFTVPLALEDVR